MRYYLDTNILAFLVMCEEGLSPDTAAVLSDYDSILLTSPVCVHELLHIIQIGKLRRRRREDLHRAAEEAYLALGRIGVRVVPLSDYHFIEYARLPILGDHRDPFDRLIIAQAIADRIPLVSSDRKFALYTSSGLGFILNER